MKGTTTLSVRVAAGYNPGEDAARKEGEAAWEPAGSATRHPPSSAGSLAFACRAYGGPRTTPSPWPGKPTPAAGRPSGCPPVLRTTPKAFSASSASTNAGSRTTGADIAVSGKTSGGGLQG